MPLLETILTVISSIIGGFVATMLATYLPRRTVVASSREAFMFALKDYDNTFAKLLNETRKYIEIALALQVIIGVAVILILFLFGASLALIIIVMSIIISLLRMFSLFIKPLIKSKRVRESALNGINNNASAAVNTAVLSFLILLSKLINAKLLWQSYLVIAVTLLVIWLFLAYFPTILPFILKFDYFEDDEIIPWDLELVNIWLSDPDIRKGNSTNGSPLVALLLDNGQKVERRLVRVKKWGMILEDISKHAKLYIRWERIITVEFIATIN
jgi:hypothetical protein